MWETKWRDYNLEFLDTGFDMIKIMDIGNSPTLKAALFDLDDTLLDHQYCTRCGLTAIQEQYLCFQNIPLEIIEQENFRLRNELHIECMTGELSLDQVRVERFRRLFSFFGEEISTTTAKSA